MSPVFTVSASFLCSFLADVLSIPVACFINSLASSSSVITGSLLSSPVNVFPAIDVMNFLNAKSNSFGSGISGCNIRCSKSSSSCLLVVP